jgi:hypothetical protein
MMAIVPKTYVRYDVVYFILQSVGQFPSMLVAFSGVATIQPWYPFSFSTEPSLAVQSAMVSGIV